MLLLLARAFLHLLANAVGLIVATVLLSGFRIDTVSFVAVVVIFTAVEVVAGPLLVSISLRQIPALTGGIALVTTFVGLLITDWASSGLSIDGISTWVLASLIIWLFSLIAGIMLPLLIFKKTFAAAKRR